MTDHEAFESLQPDLEAVGKVRKPDKPVPVYLQEMEGLNDWVKVDNPLFVKANFDQRVFDGFPVRIAALRDAEAVWITSRNTKKELIKQVKAFVSEGLLLLGDVTSAMDLAFDGHDDLLAVVKGTRKGVAKKNLALKLDVLYTLGIQNKALLATINFDMTKIDRCAELSQKLGAMLGAASSEKRKGSVEKQNRDRAYTLCKGSADKIRRFGKHLVRNDKERLKGYSSMYQHQQYQKRKAALLQETAAAKTSAE